MPSSVTVLWATAVHAALYSIFVFAYALFVGDRAGALFIIAAQAFGYLGMGWLQIARSGNRPGVSSTVSAVFVTMSIICAAIACAHVAFWRG